MKELEIKERVAKELEDVSICNAMLYTLAHIISDLSKMDSVYKFDKNNLVEKTVQLHRELVIELSARKLGAEIGFWKDPEEVK